MSNQKIAIIGAPGISTDLIAALRGFKCSANEFMLEPSADFNCGTAFEPVEFEINFKPTRIRLSKRNPFFRMWQFATGQHLSSLSRKQRIRRRRLQARNRAMPRSDFGVESFIAERAELRRRADQAVSRLLNEALIPAPTAH